METIEIIMQSIKIVGIVIGGYFIIKMTNTLDKIKISVEEIKENCKECLKNTKGESK